MGESKTVTIQADEAYGKRYEQLVVSVPNDELPNDLQPSVGMELESQGSDGQVTTLTITEVGENSITVDANHPLVSQVLQFEIKLIEIT